MLLRSLGARPPRSGPMLDVVALTDCVGSGRPGGLPVSAGRPVSGQSLVVGSRSGLSSLDRSWASHDQSPAVQTSIDWPPNTPAVRRLEGRLHHGVGDIALCAACPTRWRAERDPSRAMPPTCHQHATNGPRWINGGFLAAAPGAPPLQCLLRGGVPITTAAQAFARKAASCAMLAARGQQTPSVTARKMP